MNKIFISISFSPVLNKAILFKKFSNLSYCGPSSLNLITSILFLYSFGNKFISFSKYYWIYR